MRVVGMGIVRGTGWDFKKNVHNLLFYVFIVTAPQENVHSLFFEIRHESFEVVTSDGRRFASHVAELARIRVAVNLALAHMRCTMWHVLGLRGWRS